MQLPASRRAAAAAAGAAGAGRRAPVAAAGAQAASSVLIMGGSGAAPGGSVLPTLLASSTASAMARIPCHPLDTIKARLQVQGKGGRLADGSPGYSGMRSCLWGILRTEGVAGLYRGIGITLPGSVPAGCMYFTSYELCHNQLDEAMPSYPITASLSAGFLAEAFSCVLWVPIDVIKERLQVQSALPTDAKRYRSSQHAFVEICRHEGMSGIYRGYAATLYSFGPFSAFYFGFYENFKTMSASTWANGDSKKLPMPALVCCSAGAGSMAAWLSSPLDMIKLRIQVQRQRQRQQQPQTTSKAACSSSAASGSSGSGGFSFGYRGVLHGLTRVAHEEGVAALWKGAGTRMCFTVPNMSISMVAFEWCKRRYAELLEP